MDDGSVKIQSGININIKRTDGEYDHAGDITEAIILFHTIPSRNWLLLVPDGTAGRDHIIHLVLS